MKNSFLLLAVPNTQSIIEKFNIALILSIAERKQRKKKIANTTKLLKPT